MDCIPPNLPTLTHSCDPDSMTARNSTAIGHYSLRLSSSSDIIFQVTDTTMPAPPNDHTVALLAQPDVSHLSNNLSKETVSARKATHAVRQKTLKILETKCRLKKKVTFTLHGGDLEGLLAAGVKAQQKRKAAGVRRLKRRREELESPTQAQVGSPVKFRVLGLDGEEADHKTSVKVVTGTVIPRSVHAMSTRRSSKLGSLEALG